jgi:hypothetical protein
LRRSRRRCVTGLCPGVVLGAAERRDRSYREGECIEAWGKEEKKVVSEALEEGVSAPYVSCSSSRRPDKKDVGVSHFAP